MGRFKIEIQEQINQSYAFNDVDAWRRYQHKKYSQELEKIFFWDAGKRGLDFVKADEEYRRNKSRIYQEMKDVFTFQKIKDQIFISIIIDLELV